MREAVNIYVASSYLSRVIIDDIKANLNTMPFKGGKNFQFLLNHDFHEDPAMRQVLINMILELPNTEVRVYKGKRFFHPKLYLFESGNSIYAAVGSFNATAGGAGANIEAGIATSDRELYNQAKAFFREYWESEFTEVAQYDETAVFVERQFKPGDSVVVISSEQRGVILKETPEMVKNEWVYSVFTSAGLQKIKESNLRHLEIAYYGYETGLTAVKVRVEQWLKNYILQKVLDLPDKMIVSYASSRTKLLAYQFRPLMKIMTTKEQRLLIADEVGLGKTIEAGIILKEFTTRSAMERVLVIVPNSLRTKWQDELRLRFDEYYDILSARDVMRFLDDYRKSKSIYIKGIISYDQLITNALRKKLEKMSDLPIFDMVIVDEAHHLKNEATHRHRIVKSLTRNANILIMLTATPIQLAIKELYNLLSILLPGMYVIDEAVGFSARLVLNERINQAIGHLRDRKFFLLHEVIEELSTKRAFQGELSQFSNAACVLTKCRNANEQMSEAELDEIAKDLYGLNMLNQHVVRTLRKEVAIEFPDRVVQTQEYEYSDAEKRLYDAIFVVCREKYQNGRAAFALIMPERRAASSLFAMFQTMMTDDWSVQLSEYLDSIDIFEESDDIGDASMEGLNTNVSSAFGEYKLPAKDSKLQKLLQIVQSVFATSEQDANQKIMIFSTFRATIKYLKEQLQTAFPMTIVETITGEDEMIDRDRKRKLFASERRPAILICSEVAGEGLDFQFCHILINYDMPWNPAKLEQRVGRIDRIGQKAEKVIIINLVNKYTIEDHIMAKLFERVKIFNSAIGPLGNILSQYQRQFSRSTLQPKRTKQEKEKYEKQILKNIDKSAAEQKEFEKKQPELFGVTDYFYDETMSVPSYFKQNEIELLWRSFLHAYSSANNTSLKTGEHNTKFSVAVDRHTRKMFEELVNLSMRSHFDRRKTEHYHKRISSLAEKKRNLYYTFDHKCALEDMQLEYLTISHTFIQGAVYYLRDSYKKNSSILACQLQSSKFSPGRYALYIYRFDIISTAAAHIEYVEERIIALGVDALKTTLTDGIAMYDEIVKHATDDEQNTADQFELMGSDEKLVQRAEELARDILIRYRKRTSTDLARKKISLYRHYQNRIDVLVRNLRFIHNQHERENHEKEIERLKRERDDKLSESKETQLRVVIKCTGIIRVTNKGGST